MSKQPADPSTSGQNLDGQPFSKTTLSANRREIQSSNEMGEFEDAWEDEVESDSEVVGGGSDEDEDGMLKSKKVSYSAYSVFCLGMDVDGIMPAIEESEEPAPAPKVFVPGLHTLGQDEVLEADESVYIMRHAMRVNWPCLSFDILRDSLGDERRRFPATAYIVAGTQADEVKKNELLIYKMSSLHKTQKDGGE